MELTNWYVLITYDLEIIDEFDHLDVHTPFKAELIKLTKGKVLSTNTTIYSLISATTAESALVKIKTLIQKANDNINVQFKKEEGKAFECWVTYSIQAGPTVPECHVY